MKSYGKLDWAVSCGKIPMPETGKESDMYSHDKIAILNTSEQTVLVEFFILYEDQEPVGTYCVRVQAQRLRKLKFNDVIDPAAIELERNYACLIRASEPVVIQFSRRDTSPGTALLGSTAYPVEP